MKNKDSRDLRFKKRDCVQVDSLEQFELIKHYFVISAKGMQEFDRLISGFDWPIFITHSDTFQGGDKIAVNQGPGDFRVVPFKRGVL